MRDKVKDPDESTWLHRVYIFRRGQRAADRIRRRPGGAGIDGGGQGLPENGNLDKQTHRRQQAQLKAAVPIAAECAWKQHMLKVGAQSGQGARDARLRRRLAAASPAKARAAGSKVSSRLRW